MKTFRIFGIALSSLLIASASYGVEPRVSQDAGLTTVSSPEMSCHKQATGWTDEDRQEFYHTSPGTQLLPYDWFLALKFEHKGKERPFKDVMPLFGLIPDQNVSHNPDRLPVGLAKTLGSSLATPQLGITCAFCHTSQITYQGQAIRIEGGASMQNNAQFVQALIASLGATLRDPAKFKAFADSVLGSRAGSASDRDSLKKALASHLRGMFLRASKDSSPREWGPGRFDALGRGGNLVFGQLDPDNIRHANASASIPALWCAWEYDWVQWNGSIQHPLARNIAQVIGVNADLFTNPADHFTPYVDPNDRFQSSVDVKNLARLEDLAKKLKPPHWPQQFPSIDQALAARGKDLYYGDKYHCAHCHVAQPLPAPTVHGQRLHVKMISLSEVGTDPSHAANFRSRTASTGDDPPPKGLRMGRMRASEATEYVTTEIMKREGITVGSDNEWRAPLEYIARPHAGIWATPPYLHNGSVPTLYELLLPAEKRTGCFYLGPDFEFDPRQVGFVIGKCDGKSNPGDPTTGFEFDTTKPGNWNMGHEFRNDDRAGHTFTPAQCEDHIKHAKDGILGCEIAPDDRRAIIEYLKTL